MTSLTTRMKSGGPDLLALVQPVGVCADSGLVAALDRVHVGASGAGVEYAADGDSKRRAVVLLQLAVSTVTVGCVCRPPLQERVVAIGVPTYCRPSPRSLMR